MKTCLIVGVGMVAAVMLISINGGGYWIFKSGKRIGSRKGYNVGRFRRRRRR